MKMNVSCWHRWRNHLWQVVGGVSVRTKILGIVLLMVIVPGAVVTFQVRATLAEAFRTQLRQQGIAIARDISARAVDLVLINDLYALNRLLLDTLNHNPDVRYIYVTNTNNQVIAHTFGNGFPLSLLNINQPRLSTKYRIQPFRSEEGQMWDIAVPIFEGRAGMVHVGLEETRVWHVVNTVTWQILFSILAAFLLGIGAAYALTWILTRPILQLVAATQRVGQGDYSQRVKRWANDEIGDLADAFNQMVERLARAEAERAEREQMRQFYLQRIIQAQEEERKRIARELHDELGQALASFMVGLRNIEEAHTPREIQARLEEMRTTIAITLERARRLAFELRPTVLDDLGLVAALRRYINEYQERFGIRVTMEASTLEGHRLLPEVETTVYRIVQEALTNAARYSGCHHISVLLQMREGMLSTIVEDDGRGFDVDEVLSRKVGRTSLGLYGMIERAQLLGGQLDIESQPEGGTAIYVRIPLDGQDEIATEQTTVADVESAL